MNKCSYVNIKEMSGKGKYYEEIKAGKIVPDGSAPVAAGATNANAISASKEFIEKNYLDLSQDGSFSSRDAFGSHDDSDHVYNTARAWYMLRTLNPRTKVWDGPNAEYTPFSDDLPLVYLGELANMPEHGIFIGQSGKCYFGYHLWDFRELREDEV